MQGNRIRAAVNRGEVQFGTWISRARDPMILTALKATGLDFIRLDMEHAPRDLETVADLALFARALDLPLVVRPPASSKEWVAKLLDAGVWNLNCPDVATPEQAAEIVAASHYAPMGQRGMAGKGPHTDYEMGLNQAEQMKFANEQVFITVMLEDKRAFNHLDEIAAMPGIDALTIGPADLSVSLGVFGTPKQADALEEHRQLMFAAAKKHGKTCAMAVGSVEEARRLKAQGVLLLAYSTELDVLQNAYRRALGELRA